MFIENKRQWFEHFIDCVSQDFVISSTKFKNSQFVGNGNKIEVDNN